MLAFLKESVRARAGSEKILWILLLLFLFAISFSIAVSHILLTAAFLVYCYRKLTVDRALPRAPLLVPALGFTYCVVLSVIFSIHPSQSVVHAKEIALFIIIPILYDSIRDIDDIKVMYGVLIFAGVISAAYGLMQFFEVHGVITERITGFMGNWMTFSGLLMILNVLLFSNLLFLKKHPVWFYPAFGLLSVTLLLTLTRNAWLGFLSASFILIAMRKVRWMIAVPAVAAIVFIGSVLIFPSTVGHRMQDMFNPDETSARDRVLMLKGGWQIIRDYPLTGVGSGMIPQVYPRYRAADSVFRNNQHLHNNLVQLAAENGILALMAWLWLIGKVLLDLIHWKRNVMSPEEKFIIYGTMGILISLMVAGMFEYNFGDSEIKMLFLVLITVPYAWHRQILKKEATVKESAAPATLTPQVAM